MIQGVFVNICFPEVSNLSLWCFSVSLHGNNVNSAFQRRSFRLMLCSSLFSFCFSALLSPLLTIHFFLSYHHLPNLGLLPTPLASHYPFPFPYISLSTDFTESFAQSITVLLSLAPLVEEASMSDESRLSMTLPSLSSPLNLAYLTH